MVEVVLDIPQQRRQPSTKVPAGLGNIAEQVHQIVDDLMPQVV